MKSIKVCKIAEVAGGEILCGDADTDVTNIQYDSRAVRDGSLFVPIKGAKVDAHKFIEECLSKGASAVLTEYDAPAGACKPYIKVDNTLTALQALAAWYRKQFSLKLIGVTGSVGKTSTKEMIAAALSRGLDVMKTQGNKNSQIGMPMTMFDLEDHHEAAVIEMGMSYFGEMERLCAVAQPDMAVITNIGTAHIENLGSRENIMSEKLKITNGFSDGGILFLNGDDELLSTLHGKLDFSTVTFGFGSGCDYRAENIRVSGMNTIFTLIAPYETEEVEIPALGEHNVKNALAAYAVARACGLAPKVIKEGLLTYRNAPMRQQIHTFDKFTLIDDSYNASPDAMRVSLDVLKSIDATRRIAVLANMLELGDFAESEHFSVGRHLGEIGIDCVICIGDLARHIAEGAREANPNVVAKCFGSNSDAAEYLKTQMIDGCAILVKGSRSMHTEEIAAECLRTQDAAGCPRGQDAAGYPRGQDA